MDRIDISVNFEHAVAYAFFLAMSIPAGLALREFFHIRRLVREGTAAEGTIVSYRQSWRKQTPLLAVGVRYDPANPQRTARLESALDPWTPFAKALLFVVVAIASVVMLGRSEY
jgi:hypothetical protein